MTDEEFGRAWAEMMGVEVRKADDTLLGSKWWRIRDARLPNWFRVDLFHLSAADAYAALGAAVRAVHAAVPHLPPPGAHA